MGDKRSYAYNRYQERVSALPFSMRMQPELCERIARDLKTAIENINEVISDFEGISITSNLQTALSVFKSKLNKYALIGSDCSWQEYDGELAQSLAQIDMCYGVLLKKQVYRISDVVYISNTLRDIKQVFEEKADEYNELVGL